MVSSVCARVVWLAGAVALLASCDRYPRDNPIDPVNQPENRDGGAADSGLLEPPSLSIFSEVSVDDDPQAYPLNNGNGRIEPGESVFLSIRLINHGQTVANGVTAIVTSESDCVLSTHVQGTRGAPAPYGDIEPGQVSPSDGAPFSFEIGFSPTGCVAGDDVPFTLEATDETGESWELEFDVPISQSDADLSIEGFTIADDLSDSPYNNGNQSIEPGERVHLRVFVKNSGNSLARGVRATIASESACVTSTRVQGTQGAPFPYGDIAPGVTKPDVGQRVSAFFEIVFSPESCAPDDEVPLLLPASDASTRQWELPFPVTVVRTTAEIVYYRHTVDDSPTLLETNDGDGRVDPAETVRFFVRLRNSGSSTARQVTLGVAENQPPCVSQVRIETTSGRITHGDMLAGSSTALPTGGNYVEATFTDTCSSGRAVTLNLVAEDYSGNTWPVDLPVEVQ